MKTHFRIYTAGMLASFALAALSLSSRAQTTNYIVDTFEPAGIGTNSYASGYIGNVWYTWFGSALQSVTWDSTANAGGGGAGSGSMLITAAFDGTQGSQFLVFNGYNGFNPGLNAYQYTNFQCDVKFDPSSPTTVNGAVTNYGNLQFGVETFPANGQDYGLGNIEVPVGDSSWHHINTALNASTDPALQTITNVLIHIYGGYHSPYLNGTTLLWVDNIEFVGMTNLPTQLPPPRIAAVQPAIPALRIFAGDPGQYNPRENIATADQSGGFYGNGGTTYSITFTNFPGLNYTSFEFHMFIIPTAYLSSGPYADQWADWNGTNVLSWRISPNTSNYYSVVAYKVGLSGANPNVQLGQITNGTAIGTWTLAFDNTASSVVLTTPSGNFTSFSMPGADAATFANPAVAYFGVEANSTNSWGQAVDIKEISIDSMGLDDPFSTDTTFDDGAWTVVATVTNSIWLTTPGPKYWVHWTIPDFNFGLGESTNLTKWVSPTNFSGGAVYDVRLITTNRWALLLTNHVPNSKNLFFGLRNPAPTN